MAERKTIAEAIEEEEKKGKKANAQTLNSLKAVAEKSGVSAEPAKATEKASTKTEKSSSAASSTSSTKKNAVSSYSVWTETGGVQNYTGDDAQLAYDEAKARKKEAKKNGTEANLDDLLTSAKEKLAAAEAEKKKKAAAAAAAQKQQTPASTTPVSKEPAKEPTAPAAKKSAAELKAEIQEKKQAAIDRGSAKTSEEIKADKEATRAANLEKVSTAAYLPTIGLKSEQEKAKKETGALATVNKAVKEYTDAARTAQKDRDLTGPGKAEAEKEAAMIAQKDRDLAGTTAKAYGEQQQAAMIARKDKDLLGPQKQERTVPERLGDWKDYDLDAAKKQSERLQEMIDEIATLSKADVINAQRAGGKGTRQNETATAKEYQAQQEKANVLRAKKAALDAEIAKAEEWRLYALIPEEKDFLETAKKGKAEYLSGEHLPNDMAKTQYREYVAAGGDPESYAESVYGYFSGPMLDQYTEDEKNIYYYLYATDKERAEQFAWFANDRVATDQKAADYQKVYELAKKDPTKILPTAFNIAGAAVSGVDAIENVLDYTLEGRIRPKLGISGAVNASTEAVTEDMSDAGKFLYSTGVSILENTALIYTLGPLAGIPMAFSAAADGMNDALERGATDEQAILYGTASGIAEAVFEEISIDKLITMKDSRTIRQAVENVLIQGGIEASEEAMTTIANTVSDAMIMGDKAKLALEYQELLEQYPPEIAEEMAFKNWWGEVGLDALGGFISGEVMSGGKITYSHLTNRIVTTDQATRDRIGANVAETAGRLGEQMDVSKADQLSAALQKAMAGKFVTNAEDKAIRDSRAAQIVFAQETGTEYNSGEVRAQKDIIKELTGIDPNAPTKLTEDFDTWNKRTSTETENKKAPATETVSTVSTESAEEQSRKALAEKLGIKTGPTELKEDFETWNRKQAEEKEKIEEVKKLPLVEKLKMIRKKVFPETLSHVDFGETPRTIEKTIGIEKRLPLAMNVTKAFNAMEGGKSVEGEHRHALGEEGLAKIPEAMNDPIKVVKQPNGRYGIVVEIEENEGSVYVALEIDTTVNTKGNREKANLIVTAFGTDENYIKNKVSEGTEMFIIKEPFSQGSGQRQLLNGVNENGSSDNSISENSEKSNSFSENSENWRQTMTEEKAAQFDEAVKLGERRGNKVIISTEIPGEGRHDPDGTIYLNPNAEHPVREVLIHEFTHDIETSEVYERFSKVVLDIAERINGANIAQMKEQIRLEEPGLDDPGVERELVARFAGSRLFTDQNMVNRLFDTDQTVFRKIKNWISDALTKVFGSEERKELLQAEKLYIRAMNSRGQVDGVGEGQNFSQNGESFKGSSYEEMLAAQMEKLQKNGAKTGVTMEVDDWVEMAKNMSAKLDIGTLEWKDPARALDTIAGRNRKIRNELYELIEKPLHESQGKYATNLKEKVGAMSQKFAELGIKAKSAESKAVQWIGEGQKEIGKNGETESYTLLDLQHDFPEKWKDIKAAADYCREVYDQYLKDLNDMYSEIYPATKEAAEEQLENYRMAEKALKKKAENLGEVEKRLLERLSEKRKALSGMRKGNRNYAETENQILSLQKSLASTREDIRRYNTMAFEKETKRKLLAAQIESGDILKNRQIKARKDYFRHFQEMSDQWRQLLDVFQNDQRISTGLIGVSENTRPKTMWTSIAQERANQNYYTEDAVSGIMQYATIAEKLLAFNPTISKLRSVSATIRNAGELADMEKEGSGKSAGTAAQWVDNLANNVAGKTDRLDRVLTEKIPGTQGRKILKAINILNSRVKSNAILGNIRSAIVQVSNVTNAASYMYDPKDWIRGVVALSDSMRNKAGETAAARAQSSFMERRYMDDTISELQKAIESDGILHKPKEFALWMLGAGDRGAAELIWHTAYTQYLENPGAAMKNAGRNYENAIDFADDITRRSVAGRGEGDIALNETSKIMNLLAPFQIEVNNTWQNLKEQVGKKNAAGIVAFEIVTTVLNGAFEAIINDRPLPFDFLDAFGLTDFLKKLFRIEDDEEEEKTFGDRFKDATGEFVSGLPMGTQVAEIVKDVTGLTDNQFDLFGEKDPTKYGTGTMGVSALGDVLSTGMKAYDTATRDYLEWLKGNKLDTLRATGIDVLDAVAPVAFPWGGKQVSRTVQGLDQILQGGNYAYNSDGERYLKFPQGDKGTVNTAKTLLLGRYGSERGQEYLDNGFKKLTPKETEQYEQAGKIGVNQEDFFDYLISAKSVKTDEGKRRLLLRDQNFTAGEKNRLDQILFPDKEFRDYQSAKTFLYTGMTDKQQHAYDAGVSTEDFDSWSRLYSDLAGEGKQARFVEILDKNKDFTPRQKQAILEAAAGTENSVFTGDNDRNDKLYDAIGLTDKQKDTVRYIKAVTGNQEEETAELLKAGFSDELATKIVKADSWKKDADSSTAKNYESTGLSDEDQYKVYNVIQTTDSEEEIAAIAKELGISEAEAKVIRQKATGYYMDSIDDLTETRQAKVPKFEDYGFTAEEIVAGYNALYSCDNVDEKKAELRRAFSEMGYSGAKLDKKIADFYGINQNLKAYR